jgi:hypothetical protein
MRLKDEIVWYSGGMLWAVRPVGCAGPAVIPVTALRAWLEEQHTSIVGKATVAAMLAELEGVA